MVRTHHLDIQSKIILVLVAVIVPTFLLVTAIENKLTEPILQAEMQRMGVATAEALSGKIISNHWFAKARPSLVPQIENEIQDQIYRQPNILRLDVYERDPDTGVFTLVASNMEEEVGGVPSTIPAVDQSTSEFKRDDDGTTFWEITVPITRRGPKAHKPTHVLGAVHLLLSTRTTARLTQAFWKITVSAAAVSVVILILVLTFFLRKTVANERKLRVAEDQNLQLSEQLHEAQRELMNVEKLAVMGQLTANFAHEIGTPLNAVGGHLQLLEEELESKGTPKQEERLRIINGELSRIEKIVKGFLQTTAKPVSQPQLVDLNRLVEKTLTIVRPRLDRLEIHGGLELDRTMGPVRVVPLDVEQILLNLVNNSLDSLQDKKADSVKSRLELRLATRVFRREAQEWAEISVRDSGMGIGKADLQKVTHPFFTTKRPGEGTGLGLTICQQLASKYGGVLEIDSKEGAWTEVKLNIPYRTKA